MLLEPGPFPVIQPGAQLVPPDDPGFAALVDDQLQDLPAADTLLDGLIDPAAIFLYDPPDDGTTELHDYSAAVIDQLTNYDLEGMAAQIEPLKAMGDEGIIAAYQTIPGEAFMPVPAEFQDSGGPPATPITNPLGILFENLSRPGATDFAVGEQYQVTATIAQVPGGGGIFANVDVILYPWCEDQAQASILVGTTDRLGNLKASGTFLPDQWGRWGGTFYSRTQAGALMAGQTIFWEVSLVAGQPTPPIDPNMPAVRTPLNIGQVNAPPQVPSGITVTLLNDTRPDDPNYRVMDYWTLTVHGQPGQDVHIWGTYQGDPLVDVILGQTDGNGDFVLDGQMDDPMFVGAWIERYTVGTTEWEGSLSFAVTE